MYPQTWLQFLHSYPPHQKRSADLQPNDGTELFRSWLFYANKNQWYIWVDAFQAMDYEWCSTPCMLTVKHNLAQFASCLSRKSYSMLSIHGQGTIPPLR
jgi:hypothetical protein